MRAAEAVSNAERLALVRAHRRMRLTYKELGRRVNIYPETIRYICTKWATASVDPAILPPPLMPRGRQGRFRQDS